MRSGRMGVNGSRGGKSIPQMRVRALTPLRSVRYVGVGAYGRTRGRAAGVLGRRVLNRALVLAPCAGIASGATGCNFTDRMRGSAPQSMQPEQDEFSGVA